MAPPCPVLLVRLNKQTAFSPEIFTPEASLGEEVGRGTGGQSVLGILISGYPRDMDDMKDYMSKVLLIL